MSELCGAIIVVGSLLAAIAFTYTKGVRWCCGSKRLSCSLDNFNNPDFSLRHIDPDKHYFEMALVPPVNHLAD